MWKIILILSVSLANFFSVNSQSVDLPLNQGHLAVCYNGSRFIEELYRPPISLDNLLAIIEKIENYHYFSGKYADDVASYLTSRFRADGISGKDYTNKESFRIKTVLRIINRHETYNYWPTDVFLTADEMCALHWMLSHDINTTRLQEEENINWYPTPPDRRLRRDIYDNLYDRNKYSKFPRESGVIYTGPNEQMGEDSNGEAVAAGPLIAAIAIKQSDEKAKLEDYFPQIRGTALGQRSLNKMHAISYGVNLALAALKNGNTAEESLGPTGIWNDTVCPTEYTLQKPASSATSAIVFGSFDGYFIADYLRKKAVSRVKLSHILRMYYTDGFPEGQDVRSCNRKQNIQNLLATSGHTRHEIDTEVASALLFLGQSLIGPQNEIKAHGDATEILNAVHRKYGELGPASECVSLETNIQPKVNPNVDLYIVLDRKYVTSTSYPEMGKFLAHIADFLDVSENASHIGTYVDDMKNFELFPMNYSVSEAEWKCKVKHFDATFFSQQNSDDTVETIEKLKQMLIREKEAVRLRTEKVIVPAKVVLFIRWNAVPDVDKVRWAMEHFRKDLPEVKILGAGKNYGDLQTYVPEKSDYITYMNMNNAKEDARRVVHDHLLKVGTIIYSCERESRVLDYISYLRPYYAQQHVIPSSMFNLTTQFKIEVKSFGSKLDVCITRNTDVFTKPMKSAGGICQEVGVGAASGAFASFMYGDPCSGYSAGYCPSIYIKIARNDEDKDSTTPACQTQGNDIFLQV